jgi:hypothetical protein
VKLAGFFRFEANGIAAAEVAKLFGSPFGTEAGIERDREISLGGSRTLITTQSLGPANRAIK